MNEKYERFRDRYPVFYYDGYEISKSADCVRIRYAFRIEGLCAFQPEINILTGNLNILNDADGPAARDIVFSLGLAELPSYWKCCCPPNIEVRCGSLNSAEAAWWKKLWFNGCGEFFYRNGIETDLNRFAEIRCQPDTGRVESGGPFRAGRFNIVPVGGGKDSCVTLDLLSAQKEHNYCFTVNDQPARTETAAAAGYPAGRFIRTLRTIDPELLKRHAEGFLNGHTPFSSVVAFLSFYCAYITGAANIVLSNESSANEGNIEGGGVNHQYSKSFEFEKDFADYTSARYGLPIRYFSLLRPFNELQIAKQFASLKHFHGAFRSCNAGSRQNIWCGRCPKCLFVYIILSPFLEPEELRDIFGGELLDKEELRAEFDALAGFTPEKPFECVGTADEVRAALCIAARKYAGRALKPPRLLEYYTGLRADRDAALGAKLLKAFDSEHNIPAAFTGRISEMYDDVSTFD